MNFFSVFLIFLIFKSLDFIILSLATEIIPFLGFFPYIHILFSYHLPFFIYPWGNFDGIHYLKIAQFGYSQFEQAFFPLYPLFIRLIGQIGIIRNDLLIGLLISNLSFLIGLIIFAKYLKPYKSFWTILFLLIFPTSFFFGAVYTEGLFFMLVVFTLYLLKKEKFTGAAIAAFLSSLTRFVGVFLIIPIFLQFISKGSKVHGLKSKVLVFFAPLFGLFLYSFYLLKTTGDPFYFLSSQPMFGANRSTGIIFLPQVIYRYLKIFTTASHNFQFFVSIFEFTIFNLVFFVLIWELVKLTQIILSGWRKWKGSRQRAAGHLSEHWREGNFRQAPQTIINRLGLNLFSLANLLLPTLTGTFSSIPRYALLSLSFFIFLGQMKNVYLKILIAVVFFILHILSLGFFIQGYFVS